MSIVTARAISGPEAWHGSDLARTTDWIRPIPAAAIDEIDRALHAVKARGLAWRDIRREDFSLPGFGRDLAAVSHELEYGRGVVLLRGLPVERYTDGELRQIYWGIGAHLGAARFQRVTGRKPRAAEAEHRDRLAGEGCDRDHRSITAASASTDRRAPASPR